MVQTDFGGPEAVSPQGFPEPVRGPRDVLVEVVHRGLNRLDLPQRMGPGRVPGFRLPPVPGMDFAGTVVATGTAVSWVVPGDRDVLAARETIGKVVIEP
ncbi:alcohol dehydrogenase catalytic domain-containing protein [Streptomyces akebiae]|uniref:Alcohol dehydrogenase catalytic domain-containing protein n=1 Tax=Streptomyces akebiae TaxID=2865673 RepID=A0ABX8XJF5_9ACTN|nr:alcohol dehydrogenase catalytic domain-containing protein [Streptomyces akebiae]QYX75890.1 alcohol dehydrogenase catalytic domain-containing protein [Streptomyces akebiae]